VFDSLIDSQRGPRSVWRPGTIGVALGIHACLLAAILIEDHLTPSAASETPVEVTFLRFAPPKGEPVSNLVPGAALGPPPAPEPTSGENAELHSPEPIMAPELPIDAPDWPPMLTEVLQPQRVPESISMDPEAIPPAISAAAGVEGGVPGGVPDGVRGGVPGGVPGGPPAPAGPFWVGGQVAAPVVIERVRPKYPMVAQNARIEGQVKLVALIRRDGSVGEIQVVQGLGFGCTEAAIEALKKWRFRPGHRRGLPVDVYFELTVDFILG